MEVEESNEEGKQPGASVSSSAPLAATALHAASTTARRQVSMPSLSASHRSSSRQYGVWCRLCFCMSSSANSTWPHRLVHSSRLSMASLRPSTVDTDPLAWPCNHGLSWYV